MSGLLPDAFNLSQEPENVVGIWWYCIRTGELEYSETAKGHLDPSFKLREFAKKDLSIIRGRLINIMGILYLVIFSNAAFVKVPQMVVSDLKNKINSVASRKIDCIVDDDGNDLYERKETL